MTAQVSNKWPGRYKYDCNAQLQVPVMHRPSYKQLGCNKYLHGSVTRYTTPTHTHTRSGRGDNNSDVWFLHLTSQRKQLLTYLAFVCSAHIISHLLMVTLEKAPPFPPHTTPNYPCTLKGWKSPCSSHISPYTSRMKTGMNMGISNPCSFQFHNHTWRNGRGVTWSTPVHSSAPHPQPKFPVHWTGRQVGG